MAGLGARARKRGKQFHQAYEQIDFAHARTVDRKIWARASGKSRRGVEHQGTERVARVEMWVQNASCHAGRECRSYNSDERA